MSLIIDSQHRRVPFVDIERATRNFTNVIGEGGFGRVYKGELLLSGKITDVAVKTLLSPDHGRKEFLTEMQLLSRYKHPNVVFLIGSCEERKEKILIYEYAEHGSLDQHLNMAKPKTPFPLPWKQRISICIDAARGLDYLHNHHVPENHRVIHRDIKSANILLGHNWKAMISDFGLSKIGRTNENDSYLITYGAGTKGYVDPVYNNTHILTKESDVYSFGVVLFEVLCGSVCKINVNDERQYLASVARTCYENGKLNDIVDLNLKNQMDSKSLNTFSEIAYQCLKNDRKQRPSMGLVVEKLEKALELQELADAPESLNEVSESQELKEEYKSLMEASEPLVETSESHEQTEASKSVVEASKSHEHTKESASLVEAQEVQEHKEALKSTVKASESQELAEALETSELQTCILKVNVHCDGCQRKVTNALKKIDGVYKIDIDSEYGHVTVSGNVDPVTLQKKLAKSGKNAEILDAQKSNQQINKEAKNMHVEDGKGNNKN